MSPLALSCRPVFVPSAAFPASFSTDYVESSPGAYDRGVLNVIPDGFGDGEFTHEIFFRCLSNGTYALGDTSSGLPQRQNWSNDNTARYSTSGWWFPGNFLLDGHQNSSFSAGTFSVQIADGRPRWTFGDGAAADALTGDLWGIQSTAVNTVLDNAWHHLALVRRFVAGGGGSNSDLELWMDGTLRDTQTTTSRTNMATAYWDSWIGYPANQNCWMYGVEKQSALGVISQYEDFKGQIGELRFWSQALSPGVLGQSFRQVVGNETGLVGLYRWSEQTGTTAANTLSGANNITLVNGVTWNTARPF